MAASRVAVLLQVARSPAPSCDPGRPSPATSLENRREWKRAAIYPCCSAACVLSIRGQIWKTQSEFPQVPWACFMVAVCVCVNERPACCISLEQIWNCDCIGTWQLLPKQFCKHIKSCRWRWWRRQQPCGQGQWVCSGCPEFGAGRHQTHVWRHWHSSHRTGIRSTSMCFLHLLPTSQCPVCALNPPEPITCP